jgi:hypothetical protein
MKSRQLPAWVYAARSAARCIGVALSVASILFAVLGYFGFWRHLRGDDLLDALANRLDTSYAENVSRQVRPGEPEWNPLLRVITAHVDIPRDKTPIVFARAEAITSAKSTAGEWTAPTTPIMLLFIKWPDPGSDLKKGEDYLTVGTLGDLHEWIKADQTDFDFFWRTIIFGTLSACVGVFLALPEKRPVV